jgi:hypothetical protein
MARWSSSVTSETPKDAFMSGSSKHGNALRAWGASNWVAARVAVVPSAAS